MRAGEVPNDCSDERSEKHRHGPDGSFSVDEIGCAVDLNDRKYEGRHIEGCHSGADGHRDCRIDDCSLIVITE